jgi:hypothetical protein
MITGGVDLTGDNRPDVVARSAGAGTASVFANVAGVRLSPAVSVVPNVMRTASLTRDLDGDGSPELVGATTTNRLNALPVHRQNWFAPAKAGGAVLTGMDRVLVVGDWNSDGYVDTMARQSGTGKMWLYPGSASGVSAKRGGGWTGWKGRSHITAVGDFDGDGRPDLMGRVRSGAVYLFPGRGDKGFGKPVLMRSSLPSGSFLVGVGRWDADGAPDLLVRTGTGQLLLYPGNGPGGLDDPVAMGRKYERYNTLVGAGDMDGDGRPDLLGRTGDGDMWLFLGAGPTSRRPAGKFDKRVYVTSGWGRFRLG